MLTLEVCVFPILWFYSFYPSNQGLLAFELKGDHSSTKTSLCKLLGCHLYVFPNQIISYLSVKISSQVTKAVTLMSIW